MRLPSRLPSLSTLPGLGHRSGPDVVGLDIQPGFVAAVRARVNGSILAERAACIELGADALRDGEVMDEAALAEALRQLFADSGLGKRVRVGVANQRTVLRTLELPPVTDAKELAAAVNFQAQDQVPMPLSNAVLDYHPLGIVDTPAGPRQRVVLVAAQRDMVERLLNAVRAAGLTPEGIDLSAFALIRSLYRHDPQHDGRVLYLNVDGLTNLAIAEGTVCRFTRVVGGGLEGMAAELAERRGIALTDARRRLAEADLTAPPAQAEPPLPAVEPAPAVEPSVPLAHEQDEGSEGAAGVEGAAGESLGEADEPAESREHGDTRELAMSYEELAVTPEAPPAAVAPQASDADVLTVLENGVREIAGEVRNSLDFHRSQEGGGDVSHVILSGSAQEIPGFTDALALALGVEVQPVTVGLVEGGVAAGVSPHRLAVATGLAATEAPHQ